MHSLGLLALSSSSELFILFWVVVLILLAAPILAIAAWIRVRRLERRGLPPPAPDVAQLNALERRLAEVERKLAALLAVPPAIVAPPEPRPAPPQVAPAPPPPPPRPPTPVAVAPPEAAAEAAPPRAVGIDLETLIAGRWLNRIGILALLLAVGFFLKYAFDNNWVGPTGKVAILLVVGALLLVYSQWLLGRGYRYFSEGIAGLGAGVLYLALYAAWDYFKIFPQSVSFVGMMVVTAAMVAIALGRNSQRIALVALTGGFLTPVLVSTGTDQQVVLFSYLAVLNAGLLALGRARDWRSLELLCFIATQVYFWSWYAEFYDDTKLLRTAAFATLFFLLFAALPVLRSRWLGTLPTRQILLVLANAFWFLLALRAMLWPDRRWTLTVAVLTLAAAHLLVAQWAPRPKEAARSLVRVLFAGLALTFVTLAIPIRLEGKWITVAWAVEGAVLVWSGLATRVRLLRAAGLLLFAVVAVRLWTLPIAAPRLLLNARFAAFAVAVVCFALAYYFSRQQKEQLGPDEANVFALLGIGINLFALWALSLEVWDFFDRTRATAGWDATLAQQLGLSLLWTLYATALIVAGVRTRRAGLRWQALALFGLTVGKVFFYDVWLLERFYRIVSFVTLGVVLLVVSFLYQKRLMAARETGEASHDG